MTPRTFVGLLGLLLVLVLPAAASAQTVPTAPPVSETTPPPGFSTSAEQAIAVADRSPEVRDARREHGDLETEALVWDDRRWQVDYRADGEYVVEVQVSATGEVIDTWTGLQSHAYFTRDVAGTLGKPWVFIPFGLLFLAPFFDRRRPLRLLHLDLLVLLGFGVPFALLQARHGDAATWALYPPLLYLLGRMVALGFGRGRSRGPVVPHLPTVVLLVGVVLLFGARVGLNVTNDQVVDVGYASVVGADRIAQELPLYVDNASHPDTYGPINYAAYAPFEALFGWSGTWDDVPAAHAAAITFDLLTLVGLFVLGLQLRSGARGRRLGLALAWAWAAFPMTLYNLMQSSNDGLVAMLVVWSLVALSRPAVRGALLGLAVGAKFFPLAIIGLLWRGRGGRDVKGMAVTSVACGAVVAGSIVLYLPEGGLKEFWDCTLGFQLSRSPDYSVWGLYGLEPLQLALTGATVLFGVAVGFWPAGRRTLAQLAALAAAVVLALQVSAGHWFFFYVVWFAPLVLAALFGSHEEGEEPEPVAEADAAEAPAPLVAA